VVSATITYNGTVAKDVTMKVGEKVNFKYTTTPATTNKVVKWDTDDVTIASVVDGQVTALSKGTVTLTLTVDNVTAKCVIRVR
jgi:uncharacterized protein YjdB